MQVRLFLVRGLVLAMALSAGCDSGTQSAGSDASASGDLATRKDAAVVVDDLASRDARLDAPAPGDSAIVDQGPPADLSCPMGQAACMGGCIDITTDPKNCGACALVCGMGALCAGSQCVCPQGQVLCAGVCVATATDPKNCGQCGTVCPMGQVCNTGVCQVSCAMGLVPCSGVCVDLQSNGTNCGACGIACAGGAVCTAGVCACPIGKTMCNGACVDTRSDPANCGACGNSCVMAAVCSGGVCKLTCAQGLMACNNACVDLQSDTSNCGGCGKTCPPNTACVSALCCPFGLINCGGSCVNPQFDNANCNGCGKKCSGGTFCSAAACVCPMGQLSCNAKCVDPSSDPANCGACNTVCPIGQVCSNGLCKVTCAQGLTVCNAACVNLQTDAANCGACAKACPMGTTCQAAVCTCPVGLSLCNGACVDEKNDPKNCGTCGTICAQGQQCVAGACQLVCAQGRIACGMACVDPMVDAANCGGCFRTCVVGATCQKGVCCGAGRTNCGGVCVNLAADPANCGTCGTVCPNGGSCQKGLCCAAGLSNCNGVCVDLTGDSANCGGCNNVCAMGLTCGGGGTPGLCGTPCVNLCLQQAVCDGGTTTVSGTVFAPTNPNLGYGNPDPLYNAFVFIPNSAVLPFTAGVSCDNCGAGVSGTPLVSATTGADGKFSLQNAPCGKNIPLVIQLGRWRRKIIIPTVACCANTQLTQNQTRLPRNKAEGDIPLLAVVTGNSDPIECVLPKIGIDLAEFTLPSGNGRVRIYADNGADLGGATPPASALWGNPLELAKYDAAIFDCVGFPDPKTAGNQQNVIDYTNAGGRVFASHYSYVWLYNIAPFSGTAVWNADQAYPPDLNAFVDTTFPKGMAFASWLNLVGASAMYGQIPVQQVRHDFDATVPPSQRWLYSDPAVVANNPVEYTFNTPVGAKPNLQCGRVLFSDFHVNTGGAGTGMFPGECGPPAPLTPQEKVLEFMIFDLTACVQVDNPKS